MKCAEIQAQLQEYVTRELDPDRRRLVDEHLVECPACQRELAVVSAVISTLDHQPVVEPGPEFTGLVLARLPRRARVPGPAWALVLVPVLGFIMWLSRGWVARELAGLAPRLDALNDALARIHLPAAAGWSQTVVFLLAAVGFGLAVTVGSVVAGWHALRD